MLHSAMRCLPVTPHENTELLVNPGPTRIQIGHMTQYDIVKYSTVHNACITPPPPPPHPMVTIYGHKKNAAKS